MKCRRVNNLWWLADGTIRIQVQVCHFKLSFYPILTIPPPHTFKDCIRSAACLSVQHGRNSVGLKRVSFYSNFLDKHQVFLTRKNLWLLKILTVEKVLFYREKKKKSRLWPPCGVQCPSFPSPSLSFSLLFLWVEVFSPWAWPTGTGYNSCLPLAPLWTYLWW